MKAADLIDQARKEIKGTDADIARRLEISRQTLSIYRKEKSPLPDHIAQELARMAGLDIAATVAEIQAGKADPRTADTWREIARRASGGTLTLMLMCALLGGALAQDSAFSGKTQNKSMTSANCILCKLMVSMSSIGQISPRPGRGRSGSGRHRRPPSSRWRRHGRIEIGAWISLWSVGPGGCRACQGVGKRHQDRPGNG